MATIIKKKKVSVRTAAVSSVSIPIYRKFSSIKTIAATFGIVIPPRKCFGIIGKYGLRTKVAIWCPSLDPGTPWNNVLANGGRTLIEEKRVKRSLNQFQESLRKEPNYDVNILRIVFLKYKRQYYFGGVYQIDKIDFTNQTVTFKRLDDPLFLVTIKKKKVKVTIEEEEIIETTVLPIE